MQELEASAVFAQEVSICLESMLMKGPHLDSMFMIIQESVVA